MQKPSQLTGINRIDLSADKQMRLISPAQRAQKLTKHFKTHDPFAIAEGLGVKVYLRSDFVELKGFYKVILGSRCIFLNSNLEDSLLRTVCAHELGHDILHRELSGLAAFNEYSAFNRSVKPEYEASAFAAALLIDEGELFELSREELTIGAIATRIGCRPELVALRMRDLNKEARRRGEEEIFSLSHIPLGSFLKD